MLFNFGKNKTFKVVYEATSGAVKVSIIDTFGKPIWVCSDKEEEVNSELHRIREDATKQGVAIVG